MLLFWVLHCQILRYEDKSLTVRSCFYGGYANINIKYKLLLLINLNLVCTRWLISKSFKLSDSQIPYV